MLEELMQEQQKLELLILQKQVGQIEHKLQQLQQSFVVEFEANQAQNDELHQVQKFEQQAGPVAGLNQKPKVVEIEMTTAHQVAKYVEIEMDPTPCSFRGMDPQKVEHIEDHNWVEHRADNSKVHFQLLVQMVYQKVVGNLELGTDLEVDNLEVRTETGIDLKVYIDTGVDLEVCTKSRVEPEVCTVSKVCTVLEVAPQVVTDYLEVAPQAIIEYLEVALQAVTDYLEVADLEQYQTS